MKTLALLLLGFLSLLWFLIQEQKKELVVLPTDTYQDLSISDPEVFVTVSENYKYGGLEKYIDAGYNGYCEKEIFNRYSQDKDDKQHLENYLSIVKNKVSYQTIKNAKEELLSNLKDDDLKYSLNISFRGPDIALFEFPLMYNHCTPVQKSMRTVLIIFNILFIVLIGLFMNILSKQDD